MKIIVVHDGTPDAKAGLAYGMKKVNSTGGELITYRLLRSVDLYGEEGAAPGTACRSLHHKRRLQKYQHDGGKQVTTSIVFADRGTDDGILAFAGKLDADLIVAPPSFDRLVATACCLVDIVTSRRGYLGDYNRPMRTAKGKNASNA